MPDQLVAEARRAGGVAVALYVIDIDGIAKQGAAALELANDYTDFIEAARRRKPTTPAAEIQQNLFPPRIVRIQGAQLAGGLLPTYEVGGDWFDFVDNRDGAWLAIADTAGTGPTAAASALRRSVLCAPPVAAETTSSRRCGSCTTRSGAWATRTST